MTVDTRCARRLLEEQSQAVVEVGLEDGR